MIQRIQSIYLLLAASLLGLQFKIPYATADTNSHTAFLDGVLDPLDNIGLLGLTGMGILLAAAAIFLYKNRPLQGKIAGLAVVVTILLILLIAFVFFNTQKTMSDAESLTIGMGGLMPLVAAIFSWLALRAIGKDEKLVRSADRLR